MSGGTYQKEEKRKNKSRTKGIKNDMIHTKEGSMDGFKEANMSSEMLSLAAKF
ncbi:MAG: hypothetical protein Q8P67_13240 [archaeon]|nr:hypothetical protein [archaeon]